MSDDPKTIYENFKGDSTLFMAHVMKDAQGMPPQYVNYSDAINQALVSGNKDLSSFAEDAQSSVKNSLLSEKFDAAANNHIQGLMDNVMGIFDGNFSLSEVWDHIKGFISASWDSTQAGMEAARFGDQAMGRLSGANGQEADKVKDIMNKDTAAPGKDALQEVRASIGSFN